MSEAFAAHISPLYETVRANEEQVQTLTILRDTLLPRLISGQLRVPEALTEAGVNTLQEEGCRIPDSHGQ